MEQFGLYYFWLYFFWGGYCFYFCVIFGLGDSSDFDVDGYLNGVDNCLLYVNVDQLDLDVDGLGDVCMFLVGDMNCDG